MKILKNNTTIENKYPMTITCENCGSELEIEESDVFKGYCGMECVTCPVCGENTYIYGDNDIVVTADNVVFPDYFYKFGGGAINKPEEIQKWIKNGINWLRKNPDYFDWWTEGSSAFCHIHNFPGDKCYNVNVGENYYNISIDYEPIDNSIKWDVKEDE